MGKNKIMGIVDSLSNNIKKVVAIISSFTVFITILNIICDYSYKIKCENYYKIPAKYFTTSIYGSLIFLLLSAFLVLFAIFPPLKQYIERKNNVSTNFSLVGNIVLSILFGGYVGLTNVLYLIEIIKSSMLPDFMINILVFFFNNIEPHLLIIIVIVLFIIGVLGLLFITEIRNLKRFKKVLLFFFSIIFTINFTIIVLGTVAKVTSSIERKTKYEFIEKDDNKYVVLSEYNNKKLVVKYQTKNQDDAVIYELFTDKYYFIDGNEYTYSYIDTEYPPIIRHQN